MSVLVVARAQAAVELVASLIRSGGVEVAGTISDDEALRRLDAGGITTLVIGGGVEAPSRQRLRAAAERQGARVIEGALRGQDPAAYVREVLLPALK